MVRVLPFKNIKRNTFLVSYKPPFVEVQYDVQVKPSLAKQIVVGFVYFATFCVVSYLINRAEQGFTAFFGLDGEILRMPAKTFVAKGAGQLSFPFKSKWTDKKGDSVLTYVLYVFKGKV